MIVYYTMKRSEQCMEQLLAQLTLFAIGPNNAIVSSLIIGTLTVVAMIIDKTKSDESD
ncbi:hypothetical protein [Macrococcoides bohemicum]|uniref:hypothetical protein n=2 Tax=Macrococcoides bohemicum TaxID=1903056 RepID=UPI001404E124|nr:hypothetical protein [Macrococcus bohemicus]